MPEYGVLRGMKLRCGNPGATGYRWYGGRGIRVCDEWKGRGGFARFIAHIGPRPSTEHQIDRIDNDGNYEPGNVRWVTQTENKRNRRNTRRYDFRGENLTAGEVSEKTGVPSDVIDARINNCGWSIDRAATEKVGLTLPERLIRTALGDLFARTGSLYAAGYDETIRRDVGEELASAFGPIRDWPAQGCDDVVFAPEVFR